MKIKYKIPVVFTAVSMVLIIIYFVITAILSASMLIGAEEKSYEDMVEQTAEAVSLEIESELQTLQTLSTNPDIIAVAEFRHANPDAPYSSSEYEKVTTFFRKITEADEYCAGMSLADSSGTIYAAATSDSPGVDINDRAYYQEAMKGNVYVSEVLSSKIDGIPFVMISCPIYSNGEVIGTIQKGIDVEMFYAIAETLTSGETGFACLVDANNMIVYHPNEDLIGTEIDNAVMEEINSDEQSITSIGFEGKYTEEPSYVCSQPLPVLNWTVVFTKDLSEILAPLKSHLISSFVFGMFLLGIVTLTTIILSRRISTPLNVLVDTVGSAKNDLSVRSNIVSNDEVGILSNEINSMIQAIQEKSNEIEELAYYNEITKLPNKHKLEKDFEVLENEDFQSTRVLISVSINNFRDINESYGRKFGDVVLEKVSCRLKQFEGNGNLYHFGINEFSFFIPRDVPKDVIYERWNEVENAFLEPFVINDKTISISLTTAVTSLDNSADVDKLQYLNDLTMRYANEKNQKIAFFSESFTEQALREEQVKDAIANGIALDEGFYCEYQPQIDVKQMKVTGVETLVRYKDSDLGFVSPGELIPIAEKTGKMVPLGEKIIRDTFKFVEGWSKEELGTLRFAINVSAAQLADANFTTFVNEMFRQYKVAPENIEFEITESMMIEIMRSKTDGSSNVLETLEAFRKQGITIAIDDFGTGYSSLSYLSNMPVDIIKIDKSFIDDIVTSASSQILVENIIKMSHDLGADVIIEGVETEDQFRMLSSLGSDTVQGYYFSKPLPAEEIKDFVIRKL